MSQLGSAIKALDNGINGTIDPMGIYAVIRTFVDVMLATEWSFDDVYYAVSTVRDKFAANTRHEKILRAFCETDLDLLPAAMMIRCGVDKEDKR